MEKGQIANCQNHRHRDAGPDAHARSRTANFGQRSVGAAHQSREVRDAFIEGAHEQSAAADNPGGRIAPYRRRGVAQRIEGLEPYDHPRLAQERVIRQWYYGARSIPDEVFRESRTA